MDQDLAPSLIFVLFLLVAYLFEPTRFNQRLFRALLSFSLLVVGCGLVFYINALPFYSAMGVVIVFNFILYSAN